MRYYAIMSSTGEFAAGLTPEHWVDLTNAARYVSPGQARRVLAYSNKAQEYRDAGAFVVECEITVRKVDP
jgi:hypothetical protein